MMRLPLPWDDVYLQLTPRWGGETFFGQIAVSLGLGLVFFGLLLWLYRYECRLVRGVTALWLLGLRFLVVLTLLIVVAWQPTVARVRSQEEPSRVLVAIDVSGSMDLADPQRTPSEKLRLARAMGLTVDALTRRQLAEQLLKHQPGLLARLAARHQVDLRAFAESSWPLATLEENQVPKSSIRRATDLRQPLLHALEARPQAVVVLSDGRHNRGPSPLPLAEELRRRSVPIFPIALGCERSVADVAIVEAHGADVFHGADANVQARVKVAGLPAADVAVELSIRGRPVLAEHRRTLKHQGPDQVYPVQFAVRPDEPGLHEMEINARLVADPGRETTLTNNRATVVVRSIEDNVRVLVADGEARWEYQYLANALVRDPQIQVERVVFMQPRIGAVSEDKLEKIGHPKTKLPAVKEGVDPLVDFDVVVLGDVSAEQLPLADRQRLERFVAERGGTLVLSAGKRFLPMGYLGPAFAGDPLVKLLPIHEPRPIQPKKGYRLELSEEGWSSPFLQMEPEPEANRKKWAEFPEHFWGVMGRLKPGAVRLAFAHDPQVNTEALIAHHRYGHGQVLFLGFESTWRWRFKAGDTYHQRFWGQVARWAAADNLLPSGNKQVRFGPRAAAYSSGQPVEVAIRFGKEVGPLPAALTPQGRILPSGSGGKSEPLAVVTLAPRAGRPGWFEGQVRDLPPGGYQVQIELPPSLAKYLPTAKAQGETATFTVRPPDNVEQRDLAVDWDLLRNLARTSGGQWFTAEDADRLVEALDRRVAKQDIAETLRPWQDVPAVWWFLGTVLSLLTVEWVSRKLAGLA